MYTAALGASESKGIVSLLCESRIRNETGAGHRRKSHRTHSPQTDEVRSNRLNVRRVKSEENVADVDTKAPSKAIISKHSITLAYVNMYEERV